MKKSIFLKEFLGVIVMMALVVAIAGAVEDGSGKTSASVAVETTVVDTTEITNWRLTSVSSSVRKDGTVSYAEFFELGETTEETSHVTPTEVMGKTLVLVEEILDESTWTLTRVYSGQ